MITEKLTELKEKSALTNQQIADLSGVPLSTVTRIFSGQTDNPSFQTISDIVNVMGGSLDEIVGVNKKLLLLLHQTIHKKGLLNFIKTHFLIKINGSKLYSFVFAHWLL